MIARPIRFDGGHIICRYVILCSHTRTLFHFSRCEMSSITFPTNFKPVPKPTMVRSTELKTPADTADFWRWAVASPYVCSAKSSDPDDKNKIALKEEYRDWYGDQGAVAKMLDIRGAFGDTGDVVHLGADAASRMGQPSTPRVIIESLQHCNFPSMLYFAWQTDQGVGLRADTIAGWLIAQLADAICDNPDDYRPFYTASPSGKTTLKIVTNGTTVALSQFTDELREHMPNQKLFDAIMTSFDSEPVSYRPYVATLMMKTASAYYDYMTTLCGIPGVEIVGSEQDWTKLIVNVIDAIIDVLSTAPASTKPDYICTPQVFVAFLKTARQTVVNIMSYAFPTSPIVIRNCPPDSTRPSSEDFFSDMFRFKENCRGSGHPYHVLGWFQTLCLRNYAYPKSVACAAWEDQQTKRQWCVVSGLTKSTRVVRDGIDILHPSYSGVVMEILNEKLFKLISMK